VNTQLEEDLYGPHEVCALVGITYRQLDYWDRTGIITCEHPAHGSGSRRLWTHVEITRLKAMVAAVEEARMTLAMLTTGALWRSTEGDQTTGGTL